MKEPQIGDRVKFMPGLKLGSCFMGDHDGVLVRELVTEDGWPKVEVRYNQHLSYIVGRHQIYLPEPKHGNKSDIELLHARLAEDNGIRHDLDEVIEKLGIYEDAPEHTEVAS